VLHNAAVYLQGKAHNVEKSTFCRSASSLWCLLARLLEVIRCISGVPLCCPNPVYNFDRMWVAKIGLPGGPQKVPVNYNELHNFITLPNIVQFLQLFYNVRIPQ